MSTPKNLTPAEAYRHDLRGYATGLGLAVLLSVIPFGAVAFGLPTIAAVWIIGVLAVVQIVVHVRYFLHVDLSPESRDDLHLLIFSAVLLFIMAAGTIWVVLNMNGRMMMPM